MAISTIRQAGHPNGVGYNTRPTLKTGGSFSYGPLFGTLGTGYIDSKTSAENTRLNDADFVANKSYSVDQWFNGGDDAIRVLPEANETFNTIGLKNVLFSNKGSPDIYIYIGNSEGTPPSPSGALILSSGESFLVEDIVLMAYAGIDPLYSGSGHLYIFGYRNVNHNTM
jgi:hypothetical protein